MRLVRGVVGTAASGRRSFNEAGDEPARRLYQETHWSNSNLGTGSGAVQILTSLLTKRRAVHPGDQRPSFSGEDYVHSVGQVRWKHDDRADFRYRLFLFVISEH